MNKLATLNIVALALSVAGCGERNEIDGKSPGIAAPDSRKDEMGKTGATSPQAAAPDSGVASDENGMTVADITGNVNTYLGKTVTVQAQVTDVLGPRAFILEEDSALGGGLDDDLLVVGAGSLTELDDEWQDQKVRVTGTVRNYVLAEVEREIGWDLDPEIEAEIEEQEPVLIAHSIERVK